MAAFSVVVLEPGRKCGGSTGTNVWAALHLMAEMREAGRAGSVATLICDGGERYLDTYYILFPGDYQGTPNSIEAG